MLKGDINNASFEVDYSEMDLPHPVTEDAVLANKAKIFSPIRGEEPPRSRMASVNESIPLADDAMAELAKRAFSAYLEHKERQELEFEVALTDRPALKKCLGCQYYHGRTYKNGGRLVCALHVDGPEVGLGECPDFEAKRIEPLPQGDRPKHASSYELASYTAPAVLWP